jgi:hypothetical protein
MNRYTQQKSSLTGCVADMWLVILPNGDGIVVDSYGSRQRDTPTFRKTSSAIQRL